MKAKNYAGVDLFRIPAALMVAAIHIAPFSTWNRVGDVLLTYCLGRIAVPFFLMVTGFFLLPGITGPKAPEASASGFFQTNLKQFQCLL